MSDFKSRGDFSKFRDKANQVHNNFYDYSFVEYTNVTTKVNITCKEHGMFQQIPYVHLRGSGCKTCAQKSRNEKNTSTTQKFIEKAKKIHGDIYDYRASNYINNRKHIKISCPNHGFFNIIPKSHLQGDICPCCAKERAIKKRHVKFIKDSKKHHLDKYDYSLVNYKSNYKKVTIVCKIHGEFRQIPKVHRTGGGCKKCAIENTKNKLSLTKKEFVKRAKKIHGDTYTYDEVDYNNFQKKVKIFCKKHSYFYQTPNNHLSGKGCNKCGRSKQTSKEERELASFVERFYKIIRNDREVIKPKEIDVFIPSLKIGIEYNGEYWHSETMKPKNHRQNKTKKALDKGVKLIHIEEKDWKRDKEKVKKYVLDILKAADKNEF